MNLEDQLCPLVHAMRLKDLGLIQESLHYHADSGIVIKTQTGFIALESTPTVGNWKEDEHNYISAFTVAELGAILPYSINGVVIIMENSEEIKYVSYPRIKTTFGSTEAQARAYMLIWLIENKYIAAREVNKRLMDV
jgi:hypothetical protein